MYGLVKIKSSDSTQNTSYNDVNALLEKETKEKHVKWSKLLMREKTEKMDAFIESSDYNDVQKKLLTAYVKCCFNRKKLLKDKEVLYDAETGAIVSIVNLNYNEQNKRFTLSNKSASGKTKTKTQKKT